MFLLWKTGVGKTGQGKGDQIVKKVTSFDGESSLNDQVTSVGESRALGGHMLFVVINMAYDVL